VTPPDTSAAFVADSDRPLAERGPDAAMDRLQAEPMLVRRPHLDGLVGMLVGFLAERVGEAF
jgi:hypothetical protein